MSQPKSKLSRRTLFAGAGTAGAVAAAASLLPGIVQETRSASPRPRSRPQKGGGYQLTEHVKRTTSPRSLTLVFSESMSPRYIRSLPPRGACLFEAARQES